MQSADILIYRANRVPVGEDQAPHLEFTREISRRFNHIFGKEPGFEEKPSKLSENLDQNAPSFTVIYAHATKNKAMKAH